MWKALLVALPVAVFSLSSVAVEKTVLRMYGSNTIGANLAPAIASAWLEDSGYSQVRRYKSSAYEGGVAAVDASGEPLKVDIHSYGSSTAFRSLLRGKAEIGMSSRLIKPAEATALEKLELGRFDTLSSEVVLGLDGIAVIVHPKNSVDSLDKALIRDIFTGNIKNWSEVGGVPGPIHVLSRDNESGTYDTFRALVLGEKKPLATSATRYASNDILSDAVVSDPQAIGFVSLSTVRRAKALAISDGNSLPLRPTAFSVATESYLLARRLFFYVPTKGISANTRGLIDFAISEKGQSTVKEAGFVSQNIIEGSLPRPGNMPREFVEFTRDGKQLSLSFRFKSGSITLDNKAKRDVDRLVLYMKQKKNAQRKLMLFGFSDSKEIMPIRALVLSTNRADTVANVLMRRSLHPARVRGYGSVAPVASNGTAAGREKNRRVDVWIQ